MWHPCKETHMPTTHKMPGKKQLLETRLWIVIIECIYIYIYSLWQDLCIYEYASFLIDQSFLPWLHIRIIWGFLKIVWGWPRPQKFENWFWVNLLHSCEPLLWTVHSWRGKMFIFAPPGVPCRRTIVDWNWGHSAESPYREQLFQSGKYMGFDVKKNLSLPLNFAYLVAV